MDTKGIASVEKLNARLADAINLRRAAGVLEWDLQTNMPPMGAEPRSKQLGLLTRLAHETLTAPETGDLIAQAEAGVKGLPDDSDAVRLVRTARRDYDQQVKVPTPLAEEISRHSAVSQEVWARCRAANDFATFQPYLEKTFDLVRQLASNLGYKNDPYDALIDLYEPGATTAQVAAMFADLKPHLIDLTKAIVDSPRFAENKPLNGSFPIAAQNAITRKLVEAVGYDFSRGRQDPAPHPFCTNFSCNDVRITTRFDETYLPMALYASLHETGHALYELGSPQEFDDTVLAGGVSMGIHESQSRMWENLVGRGRPYSRYVLPKLQETFPDLNAIDAEGLYRSVNLVSPSFIRVEADEVTYNLHVMLRFELERELLTSRLQVSDLPEAWNERMREYLGITPPDYAQGVLQDVHWSGAMVGYFPTYTLGNVVSGQLWHAIRAAIPDLESQIESGRFATLLSWLRENIHQYGRKYLPNELIERATGEPLTSRYYLEYLTAKYSDLYALAK
jgi:carboxypeptidase Taq